MPLWSRHDELLLFIAGCTIAGGTDGRISNDDVAEAVVLSASHERTFGFETTGGRGGSPVPKRLNCSVAAMKPSSVFGVSLPQQPALKLIYDTAPIGLAFLIPRLSLSSH